MDKTLIGNWAGIVWRTLNEKGKLSVDELKQATGLELAHIHAAIGWLAREENICLDNNNGLVLYVYNEQYY